jgi:stalled ribosome rescue protein Dom34
MTIRHATVWIDHKEAKIFHIEAVEAGGFDVSKVKAPHHHLTRKAEEQGHHAGSDRFFHEVAEALKDTEEVLVVGPSSAKLDFIRYVHKHDAALEPRIVGVETLDHPTDGQLVAYVRHYFHGKDRMLGLTP